MQMPSKGLTIFLSIFFVTAIAGFIKGGSLTYEVKGQFDSSKPISMTMTGCEFRPTLEKFGITQRLDCRADRTNSIYGVQAISSIVMKQGKK